MSFLHAMWITFRMLVLLALASVFVIVYGIKAMTSPMKIVMGSAVGFLVISFIIYFISSDEGGYG